MAAKKPKKTTKARRTKGLRKAKKLQANKPLYSFGASNPAVIKH